MAISQEWWDDWWDEDYSWDGLAKKDWKGWLVPEDGVPVPAGEGVKGRQATLQDYWRRAELAEDVERPEFQCPQTKRRFTRVHLPLEFRDGSQTLKGAKDDAFRAELDEILKAELAKPIVETEHTSYGVLESPDNRLQWQGAVLLDFDLAGLSTQTRSKDERIPMSLQAMNAAFSGKALFYYAAFSGYAWFDRAAFSGDASFDRAAFSMHATFERAAFLSRADFSGEGRSLTSERVDQSITLSSQSGDKGLSIKGHLKGDPAPLSITRRSVQRFIAKRAVFLGPVDFSNRDILSGPSTVESDFHGAHFFHLLKLHGSVLHRGINFGKTRVEFAVERGETKARFLPVPPALEGGLTTLKRAIPEKPQRPREFAFYGGEEAYRREVMLHKGGVEEFQEWRRKEAQAFRKGSPEDRIEYFRALEDCYRTLKLFNEDRRDRPEEGRFHRLELIARRRRGRPKYSGLQMAAFWQEKEGITIWERILSRIYGGASNYGNSVMLPLLWLIVGVFGFALAYMLMGDWFVYAPNWKHFGEALAFSLGQVLPFGPWDTPDPCTAIGQMLDPLTGPAQETCQQQLGDGFEPRTYIDGTPIGLRLLASFQSLTAIILVFLSGLAIRRRFQIN